MKYNKESMENIESYINKLYKKDFVESDSTSLEYLSKQEALYFIYYRVLNGIKDSLDKALDFEGSSFNKFKYYIFNLTNLAKTYPKDFNVVITDLPILRELLTKEIIDYGLMQKKREFDLIEDCIEDDYIRNCNSLFIAVLIRGFIGEISKQYISNTDSNFVERVNSFLFDTLLVQTDDSYPRKAL